MQLFHNHPPERRCSMNNPKFLAIQLFWTNHQTLLTGIIRWENHRKRNPAIRKQTNADHMLAFVNLVDIYEEVFKRYDPNLDFVLVKLDVQVHDVGESVIGKDTPFINKKDEIDALEYVAFMDFIKDLPLEVIIKFERAFLLQFCLKDPNIFPERARPIMAELKEHHSAEAMIFAALERLDYILFAYEQFVNIGDNIILTHVLRNQLSEMEHYAKEIPGFNEIWTPEMNEWAKTFLTENYHIYEEKRAA